MEAKPLVEIKNLTKSFLRKGAEPVHALKGIDLEAFEGEFLTVIGRSGCGKTTLLNLIGALDRPTVGEVKIEGKSLSSYSNKDLAYLRREKIGFIFQSFNLLPSLTVAENIESALFFSKIPKKEIQRRIVELLDFLELKGKSNRLPLELSVGQQQKVAIARAIVKNPLIILADEPTGEMDPIAGREILKKLVELKNKLKIALIVASHSPALGSEADRCVYLKAGKLVSQSDAGY